MSSFFWEIGVEEIPAGKLAGAIDALDNNIKKAIEENSLAQQGTTVDCQGTPRRLMVAISGLADKQPDTEEERRGPPVARAFDGDGKPTKAAEGFAKGCGVTVAELGRLQTAKGDYLAYNIKQDGKSAAKILPQIMTDIITNFPWQKSQRWGSGDMRFVRPVNWIVALLDGEILPFTTIDGMAASNQTQGHRFMARGPYTVNDVDSYKEAMSQGKVVLSSKKRKKIIRSGVEKLAEEVGGVAVISESLLMENVGLTEWPHPLLGTYDPSYLKIPSEVLITSMQYHQKYFPVQNSDGELLPNFVAVSNIDTADNKVLVTGYERVLRARLEDAAFYWKSDQSVSLESRLEGLKTVVFQAKLGTVYEKSMRIEAIAQEVVKHVPQATKEDTLHAARLCKCDLTTGMVGEFPELQGIMGSYYALASNTNKDVAGAIRDHYRPQGAADDLPATPSGMVVSIADKIDTLVGCFAVGLAPSGAKDPFALRRAALGVIRILLAGDGVRLPLKSILELAYDSYTDGVLETGKDEVTQIIVDFFYGRLKNYLKADGFDYDLIDAVQALELDDIFDVVKRVQALAKFKKQSSYAALVAANKRIANILAKSQKSPEQIKKMQSTVDKNLLTVDAEIEMYEKVVACSDVVTNCVATQVYDEALTALAQLRETIDQFFDQVMVMDENVTVRENRLALLALVRGTFGKVADVSRLVLTE
ncbi:MAG: glycine--tRNA ligase subunit beta [Magnetococcales bacterium]|nr:glycine--tRNA ligase subunit beta [Magnetococcales bacterium]